jgi:hypothetical protein
MILEPKPMGALRTRCRYRGFRVSGALHRAVTLLCVFAVVDAFFAAFKRQPALFEPDGPYAVAATA